MPTPRAASPASRRARAAGLEHDRPSRSIGSSTPLLGLPDAQRRADRQRPARPLQSARAHDVQRDAGQVEAIRVRRQREQDVRPPAATPPIASRRRSPMQRRAAHGREGDRTPPPATGPACSGCSRTTGWNSPPRRSRSCRGRRRRCRRPDRATHQGTVDRDAARQRADAARLGRRVDARDVAVGIRRRQGDAGRDVLRRHVEAAGQRDVSGAVRRRR